MTTTSTIKLTDVQLVALSAASQRADRCIAPPEHLKGGAVAKFTGSLLSKGVADEIAAAPGIPIIRRDGDRTFAPVITAAGFAARGIEAQDDADAQRSGTFEPSDASQEDDSWSAAEDGAAAGKALIPANADGAPPTSTSFSAARSSLPREGTKLAQVFALLERAEGAAVSELMTATGWLAHATRAALTGARKRG